MSETTQDLGGRLTTHVLDTAAGRPAAGLAITLWRLEGAARTSVAQARTNADGRCDAPLLEGEAMAVGPYLLEFHAGDYLRTQGHLLSEPPFLDIIPIRFAIAERTAHYHVPLLLSPFGYTTYRGS